MLRFTLGSRSILILLRTGARTSHSNVCSCAIDGVKPFKAPLVSLSFVHGTFFTSILYHVEKFCSDTFWVLSVIWLSSKLDWWLWHSIAPPHHSVEQCSHWWEIFYYNTVPRLRAAWSTLFHCSTLKNDLLNSAFCLLPYLSNWRLCTLAASTLASIYAVIAYPGA